jgi:hypothetical protein
MNRRIEIRREFDSITRKKPVLNSDVRVRGRADIRLDPLNDVNGPDMAAVGDDVGVDKPIHSIDSIRRPASA